MERITITNKARSKQILPFYDDHGRIAERFVLGDAADGEHIIPGDPGSPVQYVDQERFDELAAVHGTYLRGLLRAGEITIKGASL